MLWILGVMGIIACMLVMLGAAYILLLWVVNGLMPNPQTAQGLTVKLILFGLLYVALAFIIISNAVRAVS